MQHHKHLQNFAAVWQRPSTTNSYRSETNDDISIYLCFAVVLLHEQPPTYASKWFQHTMSTSATHEAGAYPKLVSTTTHWSRWVGAYPENRSLSAPFTFSKTLLFKIVDKGSRRFWD